MHDSVSISAYFGYDLVRIAERSPTGVRDLANQVPSPKRKRTFLWDIRLVDIARFNDVTYQKSPCRKVIDSNSQRILELS